MMNGFPNHPNSSYLYHTNNVQSSIYPTNTQNFNYGSPNHDNSNFLQNQNLISVQPVKNAIINQLPQNDGRILASNQNVFPEFTNQGPQADSANFGYQNQIYTPYSSSITTNNAYHNVTPPVSFSGSQKHSYLPQLQPQNNAYVKQSINAQSPNTLVDQMHNIQLNSKPSENTIDLMQTRNLFYDCNNKSNLPKTCFPTNCDSNIMQSTLNTLPMESNMLSKCRLPLGVHIQPFRDMDITVVQTNTIVRCRSCRTYINPFVTLTDNQRRWHCNVCSRVNDIPDEFMYDPITKSYGSPTKRPELMHSNIEYTANQDYAVRPPMAAVYVFCLDVSQASIASGYLRYACDLLIENLDKIPGDGRKQIAFFTFDSNLYFYQIREKSFRSIVWSDVTESELPVSDDLLVNIDDRKESILEFLRNLPSMFPSSVDNGNCLGYAIQVAMKLISHNGGRITVINASLPNVGPGSLTMRESKDSETKLLQPSTDFYKSHALQCANDQITVDLFCINRQYSDIASYSAICRHSSGALYYYGNFKARVHENQILDSQELLDFDRFTTDFTRYLTRKIGFEAVMRTRCSRGLDLTAFHGNLFMRSTNVIALPVVNPDASYAIQFKINGSLSEWTYVIIQAALLYTTSESDRRIRVHTICLPLSDKLDNIFHHSNGPAIAGLIAKIAIDKCSSDGLQNVRDAFINSLVDPLKVFNSSLHQNRGFKSLQCPWNLRLLAPFVAGLIRNCGFRDKNGATIDERVAMLESLRSLPLTDVLRRIYPYLVQVHPTVDTTESSDTGLSLSSASMSRDGVYLLDVGHCVYLIVSGAVTDDFVRDCFDQSSVSHLAAISPITLLLHNNDRCQQLSRVHRSVTNRSVGTTLMTVLIDDARSRARITAHMVDDRADSATMSYYEFIKTVQLAVSTN